MSDKQVFLTIVGGLMFAVVGGLLLFVPIGLLQHDAGDDACAPILPKAQGQQYRRALTSRKALELICGGEGTSRGRECHYREVLWFPVRGSRLELLSCLQKQSACRCYRRR